MDLKDIIEKEKQRLQALFDPFNQTGAWLVMDDIELGLRDRCVVTRVAPMFDARGKWTHTDFWLFHCAAGYHHDPDRYSHTMKVVKYWQDDGYELDMIDSHKRRFHLEMIMDVSEPEMVKSWKEWQAFKKENAEMFARIDAAIWEEHLARTEEE